MLGDIRLPWIREVRDIENCDIERLHCISIMYKDNFFVFLLQAAQTLKCAMQPNVDDVQITFSPKVETTFFPSTFPPIFNGERMITYAILENVKKVGLQHHWHSILCGSRSIQSLWRFPIESCSKQVVLTLSAILTICFKSFKIWLFLNVQSLN